MRPRLSVVSLFSGAGGLDVGLERAGWDTVVATDIDPVAIASLEASQKAEIPIRGRLDRTHLQGAEILQADIRDLTPADLRPRASRKDWRPSLLAGGPPCQPWSSAGLQQGFRDPRGVLISEMVRIADGLKPRYVLMENVRGLLTAAGRGRAHGDAIRVIQDEWENLGYVVRWGLMNAADYGAAQRRIRLVLLATQALHLPEIPEPTHGRHASIKRKPWVTLAELLASHPEPDPEDIVVPSGSRAKDLYALEPGTGLKTGGTVEHQRPGGHWGYRQDSFVADLNQPSRTIRAASTPDWLKLGPRSMRRLTWKECAGLQGFPQEWCFEGPRDVRFRLIGNAVQADMAQVLGESVARSLSKRPVRPLSTSPEWPEYFHRRIRGAQADHRANAESRKRHISR